MKAGEVSQETPPQQRAKRGPKYLAPRPAGHNTDSQRRPRGDSSVRGNMPLMTRPVEAGETSPPVTRPWME